MDFAFVFLVVRHAAKVVPIYIQIYFIKVPLKTL